MPRRGGGRSSGKSGGGLFGGFGGSKRSASTATKPKPTARKPPPPARKPAAAPPPAQAPAQQGGGMMSGMAGMVMQGMLFGGGSEVARRAIDSVAGPRSMQVEHVGQEGAQAAPAPRQCNDELSDFNTCMKDYGNQLSSCQMYLDVLTQCQN